MAPIIEKRKHVRQQKRRREDVEIERLQEAVERFDVSSVCEEFSQLPLSGPTMAGLRASKFASLTDIQARAIPLALGGADILGAAKTGSGKTLAFLVPVLENLYRARCVGSEAGLGAMIVSPTRELAIQIFEVLCTIGRHGHLFAAGLVIGGKSLRQEREALAKMNIVVCTPGRMLQHFSQTSGFSADGLQMLVLDEADRIMDMGFQKEVDAILEYLPAGRQTLLFSATQAKRVADLARLSVRDAEYISADAAADAATPQSLQQSYVVTALADKLDVLWGFIQAAKTCKILVFLSSGKQVRFVYESFRKMQPGLPLLHLHGRQRQAARMDITKRFSAISPACLFATDVAARGLDFPAVDWVVQLDCPEDADTYIHRVGRTARYQSDGRAVLLLDPSEEAGMLKALTAKKIPIERIEVRPKKNQSIRNMLQNLCFKDPQVKYLGQKAYISYVRSVHVQKDKDVFDLSKLRLEDFSASLGLPGTPKVRFVKGEDVKALKNAPRQHLPSPSDSSTSDDEEKDGNGHGNGDGSEAGDGAVGRDRGRKKANKTRTKWDRLQGRVNQDVLASHRQKLIQDDADADEAGTGNGNGTFNEHGDGTTAATTVPDGFMVVKRRIPVEETNDESNDGFKVAVNIAGAGDPLVIDSKRREKLLKSKKKLLKFKDKGTRLIFDDDGNAHPLYELGKEEDFHAAAAPGAERVRFLEEERARTAVADMDDKELVKTKKREKKAKRRDRERRENGEANGEDGGVSSGDDDDKPVAHVQLQDENHDGNHDDNHDGSRRWWSSGSKEGLAQRRGTSAGVPKTFEDLEAAATNLLE